MTTESTFRAIALTNIAVCLPIVLYFRIRSQATREKLARKEEGVLILVGLRLCLLLAGAVFAAYLIDPCSVSWSSLDLPEWLRWVGAFLGLIVVPPLLLWTFHSLGSNLMDTVVTRREHIMVTRGPYRRVRHPFYGVVSLWGLSMTLLTANRLIAVLRLAAIAMPVRRAGRGAQADREV